MSDIKYVQTFNSTPTNSAPSHYPIWFNSQMNSGAPLSEVPLNSAPTTQLASLLELLNNN